MPCLSSPPVTVSRRCLCQFFHATARYLIEFFVLPTGVQGPVHRFKKLCEKLQVILLSNQRKSTSNGRECEETQDDRIPDHEREHAPDNSKLQLAHLTDTESEGEVLDSPRGTGRKLSLSQVNGKEAVYYTQV